MSVHLSWIPVTPIKKNFLKGNDCSLRHILVKEFGEYDGSCYEKFTLDSEDFAYLKGVLDAGDEEVAAQVNELIEAIKKYGTIQVIYE